MVSLVVAPIVPTTQRDQKDQISVKVAPIDGEQRHNLPGSEDTRPEEKISSRAVHTFVHSHAIDQEQYLVTSPYTSLEHLLDLASIARPYQLLAQALTVMQAVRSDYATAPYIEAFNWSVVVGELKRLLSVEGDYHWKEMSFYIVVFRSQIPVTTDRSHLGRLDAMAHAEATESGGLLKYWFGVPDVNGRNLATCVWRDVEDAKLGGSGKGHRQAAKETRVLYTEWKIQRLKLIIGAEARSWDIVEWS